MKLKTKVIVLIIAIVGMSAVMSSLAFTSFTADRSSTINVATDTNGIIGLSPGSSSFVTTSSEELTIDMSTSNSNGINVNSVLKVGDSSSPSTTHAFTITNNDDNNRTVEIDYTLNSDDGNTDDNVKFEVYDSTGTSVVTLTEESGTKSFSMDSGQTYYVVTEVNTKNGVTSSTDLSGTLTVSAS